MVIEEPDFKLESDNGISWDLELLYTVRPKGKPEHSEFKIDGYGMSLFNCLRRIANYRMSLEKENYTLREYMQDYKKNLDKLRSYLKTLDAE